MTRSNAHYYDNRDPLGAKGDFVTSPEISQIFGEVIGAFFMHIWQKADSPNVVNLVEYGAGRGTLMKDLVRTARTLPDFEQALSLHMVESSPSLTDIQKQTISHVDLPKKWHENSLYIALNNDFNILILNEFMDALSTDQYVFNDEYWYKRMVDQKDGQLSFTLSNQPDKSIIFDGQEGDIYEYSHARTTQMKQVASLVKDNGLAIIIDYGAHEWGAGDTLQALSNHKAVPVLERPGQADLTSHVDFSALARVAEDEGCAIHPLISQGFFLNSLGGFIRARDLDQVEDYTRLVAPAQMGELFKVLIISSPDLMSHIKAVFPS